jgi:putative protease
MAILNYEPAWSGRSPVERLLDRGLPPPPFAPGELIIALDPFFPEAGSSSLEEDLRGQKVRGFRRFIVNNPGHFSFFRNTPCTLIAGPWLYAFNRRAAAFCLEEGAEYLVSPLENNRRNLEQTIPPGRRSLCFITVFARPALFRIRGALGGFYDFGEFTDSREEGFRLVPGPGASRVYPEKPFSIVDKLPFLREAGFSRFIVDLSGAALKKGAYRDIMRALENALPLPGTARFNWKDGFYHPPEPAPGDGAP